MVSFKPVNKPHSTGNATPPQLASPRTQRKTTETIRKIMKVALPTFSIMAASYIFLAHLPIAALSICATAATASLIISYYWIIKPLLFPSSTFTRVPDSPPFELNPFPQRSGSQSAPPIEKK